MIGLWFCGLREPQPHSFFKSQPKKPELAKSQDQPGLQVAPIHPHQVDMPKKEVTDTKAADKLEILEEIFQTKNDNDPRLDQEFNQLTPKAKEALEEKYRQLTPESRNERGTIVFLLGKNLSSEEDFKFLREVVSEKRCW